MDGGVGQVTDPNLGSDVLRPGVLAYYMGLNGIRVSVRVLQIVTTQDLFDPEHLFYDAVVRTTNDKAPGYPKGEVWSTGPRWLVQHKTKWSRGRFVMTQFTQLSTR
jgi:hypothetical protein